MWKHSNQPLPRLSHKYWTSLRPFHIQDRDSIRADVYNTVSLSYVLRTGFIRYHNLLCSVSTHSKMARHSGKCFENVTLIQSHKALRLFRSANVQLESQASESEEYVPHICLFHGRGWPIYIYIYFISRLNLRETPFAELRITCRGRDSGMPLLPEKHVGLPRRSVAFTYNDLILIVIFTSSAISSPEVLAASDILLRKSCHCNNCAMDAASVPEGNVGIWRRNTIT
jgi:hypothetical protein